MTPRRRHILVMIILLGLGHSLEHVLFASLPNDVNNFFLFRNIYVGLRNWVQRRLALERTAQYSCQMTLPGILWNLRGQEAYMGTEQN